VTQDTDDLDYVAVVRAQADVARVAVQSHEPQAALDLLVNRLRALLRARQCFVILVEGDQRLRITAWSGLSTRHREVLPLHERDGIGLTAMVERRAVSSADVLNDPAIDLSPSSRRFIESEGYRGALAVPLLADTRVLGVLLAGRDRVGSFSPDQAEVARAFSDLATMALERARLFSQEAARTRLDEALVEVEREMLAELRAERLFSMILERAGALVHAKGSIHVAEPSRRVLRKVWSTLTHGPESVPFGEGIKGMCAETGHGILVPDYVRWAQARTLYVGLGVTSAMAQPLLSPGQLLGVITMGRTEPGAPPFGPDDLAILERVAGQAALALRNATLYEEAEQRRRGAQELARLARTSPTARRDGVARKSSVLSFLLPDLSCTLRLLRPDGSLVVAASRRLCSVPRGGAWSRHRRWRCHSDVLSLDRCDGPVR
jgi:GAF domain-containing protein